MKHREGEPKTKTCISCEKRKKIDAFAIRSDNKKRRNTCMHCLRNGKRAVIFK